MCIVYKKYNKSSRQHNKYIFFNCLKQNTNSTKKYMSKN